MKLSDLSRKRAHAPFHIINAAVNIQDKVLGDGTLMDRTVDFMTLSKLYIGSRRITYNPSSNPNPNSNPVSNPNPISPH